jgi:hypothetical protein
VIAAQVTQGLWAIPALEHPINSSLSSHNHSVQRRGRRVDFGDEKALPRRLVNLTHSQMASSKPAASLITKAERLASQNAPAVGSLKQALGCQVEARQATRNLTPDRAGSLKLAFTRLVRLAQSDLQWTSVTWSTIWTVKATERNPSTR